MKHVIIKNVGTINSNLKIKESKMNLTFNLTLTDYLAIEKFAFFSGENKSYQAIKKNFTLLYYLLGITLFVLLSYLASTVLFIVMIPMILLFVIGYKKFLPNWIWVRIEPQLKKHILTYQLKENPEGMNACEFHCSEEGFSFLINEENQLFRRNSLVAVENTEDYFFLHDDRGRAMCIPQINLTRSEQDYLANWLTQESKTNGLSS